MPGSSYNHACRRGPQCTRHAATAAGDLSSQWAHKNCSCSEAAIRARPASRACMGHVLRCSFGRNRDSLQTARSMMLARWECVEVPMSEEADEWDGVLPPPEEWTLLPHDACWPLSRGEASFYLSDMLFEHAADFAQNVQGFMSFNGSELLVRRAPAPLVLTLLAQLAEDKKSFQLRTIDMIGQERWTRTFSAQTRCLRAGRIMQMLERLLERPHNQAVCLVGKGAVLLKGTDVLWDHGRKLPVTRRCRKKTDPRPCHLRGLVDPF